MVTSKPFDVVVVPFPFTERGSSKRRPALILSSTEYQEQTGHLILCMITTATRSNWFNDVSLKEWAQAGLPHASLIRAKLFTLDERLILRRLGELTDIDQQAIAKSLQSMLPLRLQP